MTKRNTRRGFTQIKRVGQALPDNAPAKRHTAAFTLIELLVVVLIIGILAAVAVPQYEKVVLKARFARAYDVIRAVDTAQQVYYLANGTHSMNFETLDLQLPAGASASSEKMVIYDDIYYQLYEETGTHNSISFYDTTEKLPRLEKYFDRNYMLCWFYGDLKQKTLCQSLSANTNCPNDKVCQIF